MNFPEADRFQTMLVEQYRMNSVIMQWSSNQMYEGRLVAHDSVSNRVLSDLLAINNTGEESKEAPEPAEVAQCPLIFIDTAGALMYEAVD